MNNTEYLNRLRFFSCILIILAHSSGYIFDRVDVNSFEFLVTNAYDCLGVLGVPLFVMISGALMLNPQKKLGLKELYIKKMLPLLMCYYGAFMFYNTLRFVLKGTSPSFVGIKDDIVLESLLSKGIYHLWFIPMLLGLYALTPIFKRVVEDKNITLYLIIIYFITSVLLPTMLLFDFKYKTIVEAMYDHLYTFNRTYIGYYLLGYYVHTYVSCHRKKLLFVLAFVSLNVTAITCLMDSRSRGEPSVIINSPLAVFDFIAVICIFMLFKSCDRGTPFRLSFLNKYTFGVYIFHPAFFVIIEHLGIEEAFIYPIVGIPLFVICAFVFSLGITAVLKELKLLVLRR